jgi:hypothetical protein
MREAFRVSGRGCDHCERNAARLVSEEGCPEMYRCPFCKSKWEFGTSFTLTWPELERISDEEIAELFDGETVSKVRIIGYF